MRETKAAFESASDPKVELEQVQWVARGLVAERSITLITGKPKVAGKSTFVAHLVAKVLDGLPFIGMLTVKTPVVVLTEERTSFVRAPEAHRVDGAGRHQVPPLQPGPGGHLRRAGRGGPGGLQGDGRQAPHHRHPGPVHRAEGRHRERPRGRLEGLKPVQEAANEGLAVIVVHHEKKSGGGVGDSSRGSTAFTGAVDIIVSVQRPEGQTSPKVRVISTLSRYPCTPDTIYVGLTETGFERREEAAVISSEIEKHLLDGGSCRGGQRAPDDAAPGRHPVQRDHRPEGGQQARGRGKLKQEGRGQEGGPAPVLAGLDGFIPPNSLP